MLEPANEDKNCKW